ncbi:MAG TPA: hypothetical protein VJU53_11870 [Burkholderiaceae bacterium]|nr:hypothetical protein [Burkholderiaceae bacterium]
MFAASGVPAACDRVGTACVFAMTLRGSAPDTVRMNRNEERAKGAVTDPGAND